MSTIKESASNSWQENQYWCIVLSFPKCQNIPLKCPASLNVSLAAMNAEKSQTSSEWKQSPTFPFYALFLKPFANNWLPRVLPVFKVNLVLQGIRGNTGDYGNIGESGPKVRSTLMRPYQAYTSVWLVLKTC